MALAGVGVGLAASYWMTRLLSAQLFQVKHTDVATFVAAPASLTVVALTAAWIPALRATRVDPLTAPRQE